jgi:hypothetical protein
MGGWKPFIIGTFATVSTPVHSGTHALQVTSSSATYNQVGMTQNTVVANSVAGKNYTASCWVLASNPNLNMKIQFIEYNQAFTAHTLLQTTLINKLTPGVWTQISVSSTALASGERMIPQIYSANQTSASGSITYDDCSVFAG